MHFFTRNLNFKFLESKSRAIFSILSNMHFIITLNILRFKIISAENSFERKGKKTSRAFRLDLRPPGQKSYERVGFSKVPTLSRAPEMS